MFGWINLKAVIFKKLG